jgi:hypothetical protein
VAAGGAVDAGAGHRPEGVGGPPGISSWEAQHVWSFLGQADAALPSFSFRPIRSRDTAPEAGVVLPLLDLTVWKIS